MNFYYFLFKKISLAILGVFITLTFLFFFLGIFINSNFSSPLVIQYFKYLLSIFTFKFGKIYNSTISNSFINPATFYFFYIKLSLIFTLITFLLSIIIGFGIGIFSAYKINTKSEILTNIIIFFFSSIPTFILAPIGIILAEKLDFPINYIDPNLLGFSFTINSFIIPVIILSLGTITIFSILTKKVLLNILNQDYVIIMKANGMSSFKIFWKVIFKNLIINQLNYLIPIYVAMVSYSMIIERIFQIPGQSLLLNSVIKMNELEILSTFIFFTSLFIYLAQALIEILYQTLNVDNKMNFYFKIQNRKINLFNEQREGVKNEIK